MTRIILVSGKGGVGKTTIAAATGLACARRGYRTIVISLDIAHSLADSFDLNQELFDQNRGLPVSVADKLEVQEIDVQEEIARHWGDVYKYLAALMMSTGLENVVAEEVAIVPGMEDVIALMYVNQYVKQRTYDVIVLDCPPTGEAIRFVSINSTMQWYMRKRFNLDSNILKLVGPLAGRLTNAPLPNDGYFSAMRNMAQRLEGVDELLVDPKSTTVRLVTNAERTVVRESQRAYMYFSMYGMVTDQVIINRVMPPAEGYFARWSELQAGYVQEIREYFEPLPIATVPMFPEEVVGRAPLDTLAETLYGDSDPAQFYLDAPVYGFQKDGNAYILRLSLPFVEQKAVDITRLADDVVVRIGSFKRHVPVPRSVSRLRTAGAQMDGSTLVIRFAE